MQTTPWPLIDHFDGNLRTEISTSDYQVRSRLVTAPAKATVIVHSKRDWAQSDSQRQYRGVLSGLPLRTKQ